MARMRALALLALATVACGKGERIYVSDEDGGAIVVIDASTDEVVARVAVGKRPRGVRVAPDGSRLYVALSGTPKSPPGVEPASPPPADRSADGIGIVDLGSLKLVALIPAGQDPEAFDLTKDGKRMWVSNEETAEASLVDLATNQVVKRVPVGKEPEGVTLHPDGKVVYVTNEADGTVSVLDADSGAVVTTIGTCSRPRAVVFTADGARGFVSCETAHAVALVDARSHTKTGELDLPGQGVRPMGLAVSADGRTVYVSGGRGKTVHVVALDGTAAHVARTIADAGARPWGVGVTRDGKTLFTANGQSGDVSVIDTASGQVRKKILVGGSPWGIAVR
jgi:YVTN family beta-propeller protein